MELGLILDNENIELYVKNQTKLFDQHSKLTIINIADQEDEETDGFVNFIFRIMDSTGKSVILKQARPYIRVFDEALLDVSRNKLEYETIRIRSGICHDYVPEIFHVDYENNAFIMEDCKDYKPLRFELSKMKRFNDLAKQISEYMSKTNFYTSEYFLSSEDHKRLQAAFVNVEMRNIMENVAFVKDYLNDGTQRDDTHEAIVKWIWRQEVVQLETLKSRDIFMKKGQCLVHGDLHTSNVLISEKNIKVIDMEYTFMGPFSADMGYFLANFIFAYSALMVREDCSTRERLSYAKYILETIEETFNNYCKGFRECWEKDAKAMYRKVPGYLENIERDFLFEAMGIMASAGICRVAGDLKLTDLNCIKDPLKRNQARSLVMLICHQVFQEREKYAGIEDLIKTIVDTSNAFMSTEGF
ncbi:S-methyl-5-thioribose kinase [Ilyobacter sp.]|uniref:S-methyl-5-thioribose kinase n=1 Tax=Ilyobacter sp. TaxID=3100343 RepID=UPI003565A00F